MHGLAGRQVVAARAETLDMSSERSSRVATERDQIFPRMQTCGCETGSRSVPQRKTNSISACASPVSVSSKTKNLFYCWRDSASPAAVSAKTCAQFHGRSVLSRSSAQDQDAKPDRFCGRVFAHYGDPTVSSRDEEVTDAASPAEKG